MGFKRGEIDHGEMAEWSIAAVLKTVELRGSGFESLSLRSKGCKSASYAIHTLSHLEISIAYKTINEPLELLDGAQRARLVFPHSPIPPPFPRLFGRAHFRHTFAVLELFKNKLEDSRRLIKTHSSGLTPQRISNYDTTRTSREARMADDG